jgi:hypothetical protein
VIGRQNSIRRNAGRRAWKVVQPKTTVERPGPSRACRAAPATTLRLIGQIRIGGLVWRGRYAPSWRRLAR